MEKVYGVYVSDNWGSKELLAIASAKEKALELINECADKQIERYIEYKLDKLAI